jgi:hypothetical protein
MKIKMDGETQLKIFETLKLQLKPEFIYGFRGCLRV